MEHSGVKKGDFVVEPGLGISALVEKINKLSFEGFPVDKILKLLSKSEMLPELLEPYTFFSDVRYTRNLIHKSPDFELLLLCWKPGQYSPAHGHEGQKCWMRVEKGQLEFTNYQEDPSNPLLLKQMDSKTGTLGFIDGPAVIHRVKNNSKQDATSLHLYARPFEQCDVYDLERHERFKAPLNYHSIHGKLVAPEDKR